MSHGVTWFRGGKEHRMLEISNNGDKIDFKNSYYHDVNNSKILIKIIMIQSFNRFSLHERSRQTGSWNG